MTSGSSPIDPPEGTYDPELPFLAVLERDVRRSALRAARHHERCKRPHAGAPARGASRIARRSLTLVALLCLIGASAYGAREALSGGTPNLAVTRQGPFVLLSSGHIGADHWSLRLYRREGELCRELVVSDNESSRCAAATGDQAVTATSVVSPLRRYVFGVAGSEVAQVSVHAGATVRVVSTHELDAAHARAAGLPVRVRWFLAILARPTDNSDPPALVQGLGNRGHALGPALLSCVETNEQQQCS
jgi:hypothetical protein